MKSTGKIRKWPIIIAFVVILATSVAMIIGFDSGEQNTSTAIETPIRAKGPEDAVVVIEEYADYGCISCRVWHQMGIADKILEKYGDTVRFEWHDFPVITSNSPIAAQAGMCAYDQGFFWEFHDVVYENYPRISVDDLKQYAVDVGLEARVFNQCLDSKKYLENVNEELKNAHRLGLRSTPSFRVNEKVLIGPPSFEQISTIVDEILEVN